MHIALDGMLLGCRLSGVEAAIARLAEALAASGTHDYSLFAQTGAAGVPPAGRLRVVSTRWPVRFRPCRILWQQLALPAALVRARANLLHAPGYVGPLRSPVPMVVTLYDLIALVHPDLCSPSNRWHYRLTIPPTVRRAAIVLVPSQATRDDAARLFPAEAGKIRIVPLGVEDRFRVIRDADAFLRLRHAHGLPERFVLFVGRTEPKKNLVRLVEAFARLKRSRDLPHHLVMAGTPSWDQARVVRAIRSQGLEGIVHHAGFIPPEDLPLLYNMADLFVFPSLSEGFGLPPLEAMACGTPVVASDGGSLPEVAGPAAILANPLAAGDMARAMDQILTNRSLRDDLVARGLRHAARFTWKRTAAATETAYAEAAKGVSAS